MRLTARCSFYYFFMVVVVVTYETKATTGRALTFVVRVFVNDTIAIAVWTSFHVCAYQIKKRDPTECQDGICPSCACPNGL